MYQRSKILRRPSGFLLLLIAISVTSCDVASAAIMYGDFSDVPPGAVMFVDVSESSDSSGDDPIFGAPSITGDILEFESPINFAAAASNGLSDKVDGTLMFGLGGIGVAIADLGFDLSGYYSLAGEVGTQSQVALLSRIDEISVHEIDGISLAAPIVLPGTDFLLTYSLPDSHGSDTP